MESFIFSYSTNEIVTPTSEWNLTPAQDEASTALLCSRLALIRGPPGTGKSFTIAAAAFRITRKLTERVHLDSRIAIFAPTLMAAEALEKKSAACTTQVDLRPNWLLVSMLHQPDEGNHLT